MTALPGESGDQRRHRLACTAHGGTTRVCRLEAAREAPEGLREALCAHMSCGGMCSVRSLLHVCLLGALVACASRACASYHELVYGLRITRIWKKGVVITIQV